MPPKDSAIVAVMWVWRAAQAGAPRQPATLCTPGRLREMATEVASVWLVDGIVHAKAFVIDRVGAGRINHPRQVQPVPELRVDDCLYQAHQVGARQVSHLLATSARRRASRVALLQRVRAIKMISKSSQAFFINPKPSIYITRVS